MKSALFWLWAFAHFWGRLVIDSHIYHAGYTDIFSFTLSFLIVLVLILIEFVLYGVFKK